MQRDILVCNAHVCVAFVRLSLWAPQPNGSQALIKRMKCRLKLDSFFFFVVDFGYCCVVLCCVFILSHSGNSSDRTITQQCVCVCVRFNMAKKKLRKLRRTYKSTLQFGGNNNFINKVESIENFGKMLNLCQVARPIHSDKKGNIK